MCYHKNTKLRPSDCNIFNIFFVVFYYFLIRDKYQEMYCCYRESYHQAKVWRRVTMMLGRLKVLMGIREYMGI